MIRLLPNPTIRSNSSSVMRKTVIIHEKGYLLGAAGTLFDFYAIKMPKQTQLVCFNFLKLSSTNAVIDVANLKFARQSLRIDRPHVTIHLVESH